VPCRVRSRLGLHIPAEAPLKRKANHAASGHGAMASVFHIERLGGAVPEPPC
jgi:hypothetical protein